MPHGNSHLTGMTTTSKEETTDTLTTSTEGQKAEGTSDQRAPGDSILSNSTSNIRVAFAGMTGGNPRTPYAC